MKSKITNFILIIGIIVFVVGFYSIFFKARLPYPDSTPEMTRKWMFYYKVGKLTMSSGAILVIIGMDIRKLIVWGWWNITKRAIVQTSIMILVLVRRMSGVTGLGYIGFQKDTKLKILNNFAPNFIQTRLKKYWHPDYTVFI